MVVESQMTHAVSFDSGPHSQAMPRVDAEPHVDAERWDLLVVGGGTAGLVGAKTAAALGARVLLVERDRLGGDCLWTGCVPSKSLLAAASAAADARGAARLGVEVSGVRVDFAAGNAARARCGRPDRPD